MAVGNVSQVGVATWQRRESRLVRPFLDAEEYLQDVALRLTTSCDFSTDNSFIIDDYDPYEISPALWVNPPPEEFAERVGSPLDLLHLLIVLEDGFLKRSTVLSNTPLAILTESRIIELPQVRELPISWLSDIRLHIAVVLGENRPAEPGVATRKGSWVARKSFRVGRSPKAPHFHIEYVDEDWFERRDLPRTTTYYVELGPDLDSPAEEAGDPVSVYVSRTVAQTLGKNESSVINQALVRTLYVDMITTVVVEGLRDMTGDPVPDGFLDVLLGRIAKDAGIPKQQIMRLGKEQSPSAVRACVQAAADLSRMLVDASRR